MDTFQYICVFNILVYPIFFQTLKKIKNFLLGVHSLICISCDTFKDILIGPYKTLVTILQWHAFSELHAGEGGNVGSYNLFYIR